MSRCSGTSRTATCRPSRLATTNCSSVRSPTHRPSARPTPTPSSPARAVWGWPAYFYSAIDAEDDNFNDTPDRRAHGGTPLLEWYLQQMAAHEAETGVRLLDVLDIHFYPQDGSYPDGIDAESRSRRLRSTRSLWDGNYSEESWIGQPVDLIPRMQKWVDDNYPGTKLSLGEYSFGAYQDITGGLAQAEALRPIRAERSVLRRTSGGSSRSSSLRPTPRCTGRSVPSGTTTGRAASSAICRSPPTRTAPSRCSPRRTRIAMRTCSCSSTSPTMKNWRLPSN